MAASAIGVVCGLIGTMFHFGVHEVTAFRGTHPWVLYLLPLAGFVIVSFYKLTETDGLGTDDIIDAVHEGKRLPILLLPAIFFGTVLTHLCGGSAGREGAALQMGGTIGQCMGRTFRLDDRDLRVATLAGMAAFFSALFGTPLAATVFAIMVISIGVLYHVALYPSLLAALVAYGVSVRLGVEPTRFTVAVPWAFLLKLVFTAVTLAAGFKGGEVVPSFFVGATFGCAVSPLLGLPVGFGAAVGLAAVFCGVTNCPVASTLLAVELFGAEGMLYFALACCLSYMLSGYQGLYSSQTILYSKLKAQFINVHTNAYHAGEKTE